MMPNFKLLVDYKRFEDYMNKWFSQTQQMKETVVLYTDKERGKIHHLFTDLSYLDKEWFEENPAKPPEENENESTFEQNKRIFKVD